MNKVFISHSSKQKELVKRIVQDLGRDHCFVDCYDFNVGEKIAHEIQRKINDSVLFCLLLSKESLVSEWVRFEENNAKDRIESGKLLFQCFIVDSELSVSDSRIMEWEKAYLLDTIPSAKLIARVIKSKLRELDFQSYNLFRLKNSLFYGRGSELSEIEGAQVIKSYDGCKAVAITGLPHVGKKRFALEVLRKITCDTRLEFCSIQLARDQSIEDLIFYLNDYLEEYSVSELTRNLSEKNMKWKQNIAASLLNHLYAYRQYLLLLDDYCLIKSDGRITSWFCDLLCSESLENHTGIYITASPRVDPRQVEDLPLVHQMLSPLSNGDMQVLFQSYSSKRGLQLDMTTIKDYSSSIGGFPCFVYDVVDGWYSRGRAGAINKLGEIKKNTEDVLSQIIELLNTDDNESVSVLVLLAKCDVISINQLSSLFSATDINKVLDRFHSMSILEYFGYAREYVRLHPVVSDYINRSRKLSISSSVIKSLSEKASALIANVNSNESNEDLPTYLYGIKNTLKNGLSSSKDISKYMVPSLALSVIVDEYENCNYSNVITLCQRMLEREKNYDWHILRSVHYWYCLALCRLNNKELLNEVEFFKEGTPARHFLVGFYYRQHGNIKRAKDEYERSLQCSYNDAESFKTKQELVLVKILLNDYEGALAMAEENYRNQPHNSFYIEAYFRCLVKNDYSDSETLLHLIDSMKNSMDNHRIAISQTMRAEYLYYREHDFWTAIQSLQDTIEANVSLKYPKDALREICHAENNSTVYHRIKDELRVKGISL